MRPALTTEQTRAYGLWKATLSAGERVEQGWGLSEPEAVYQAYKRWYQQTQTAAVLHERATG